MQEQRPVEVAGRGDGVRIKISNVPSLVCAFSASVTTGGSIYAFGIYGDALKKSLNISQMELDTISATFFVAGLFTWIPGIVVDRKGMRFSMCLGGCAGALSTMIYWAVSRQFFPVFHPVSLLSLLAVAICLSCGLIIGSIFKLTLVFGGAETRGSAVGVAKCFVGLGAGVYATIFQGLRTTSESALDFLPVIAFFFILCTALPAWFLLPTKEQAVPDLIMIQTTPLHFRTLYISLFVLGTVILVTSIIDIMNENDPSTSSSHGRDYGRVALILIIWLGPIISLLYLPGKQEKKGPLADSLTYEAQKPLGGQHDKNEEEQMVLLDSYQSSSSQIDEVVVEPPTELSLPEMLQTPSAWFMLWTTMILVGSGTYKTNNMGEMVESLGFPDALTPATLAIFSVAQAAARIITGVASEAALKIKVNSFCINSGVPRPFFLVIASFISVFAHLILMVSTSQTYFVLGCTVSAIAHGMTWPLIVLIVGDVFGLEHHGANYVRSHDGEGSLLFCSMFLSNKTLSCPDVLRWHDESCWYRSPVPVCSWECVRSTC
jgi:hypothetical protein